MIGNFFCELLCKMQRIKSKVNGAGIIHSRNLNVNIKEAKICCHSKNIFKKASELNTTSVGVNIMQKLK